MTKKFPYLMLMVGFLLPAIAQEPVLTDSVPVPNTGVAGTTITAQIPLSATPVANISHRWTSRNATGTTVSSVATTFATQVIGADSYAVFKYLPLIAGEVTFSVTWPTWTAAKNWVVSVGSGAVIESTMYTLTSSINRSATWTVANPIIRNSSAEFETLLVESFPSGQYHMVVYDQRDDISNYFQKGYHFWADDYPGVVNILERAVPDGDVNRYSVQSNP